MRTVMTYRLSDGTQVTFRPASPDDAPAIIAAVRSKAEERSYVLMEIYGQDAPTLRTSIEQLDREHNLLLVAVADGAVVGILALLDTLICSTPLPSVAVGIHLLQQWRGRGIGSGLLRYALRWAREHEYQRLEADIFTTNKRSVHLFSKAGFREDDCRRRAVQVGAQQINEVVLAKRLG